MKTKQIGQFQVKSGTVFATDPCYQRGTWCSEKVENVLNGRWFAFIEIEKDSMGYDTIYKLIAYNEVYNDVDKSLIVQEQINNIGVDSGQAGFFCSSIYPEGDITGEFGDDNTFYGKACKATLDTSDHADIVDFCGVVSSSGYGDGNYMLTIHRYNGSVVKMEIDFITVHEDGDEDEG